jgi:hypothetical protein
VSESSTEPAAAVEEYRTTGFDWLVRGLYVAAIAANLYLVWDWWSSTPEGEAMIAKVKAKAKECEGCAQRRALLHKAMNRMHFQAEQIVEGVDVETQPEQ